MLGWLDDWAGHGWGKKAGGPIVGHVESRWNGNGRTKRSLEHAFVIIYVDAGKVRARAQCLLSELPGMIRDNEDSFNFLLILLPQLIASPSLTIQKDLD